MDHAIRPRRVNCRWSERVPVELPLRISSQGRLLCTAVASNFCRDGVFVRTDGGCFTPNGILGLEFDIRNIESWGQCVFVAAVMHKSTDGAGLLFLGPDEDMIHALEIMANKALKDAD